MLVFLPTLWLVLLTGAPLPKEAKKPDPPSVVGEWVCETSSAGGHTIQFAHAKEKLTYIFFLADGKLTIHNGPVFSRADYSTDAKRNPATIDWWSPKKPVEPTLGIYKVEKDTLTLCFTSAGLADRGAAKSAARPKEFDAPAGSAHALLTLKRMKPKKE